jgi:penicillin amidase
MSTTRFLMRLLLGKRLPVTDGELKTRGPREPITIRRDRFGVPHIDARNDTDAAFAVGFCQGQDRAGQLEVMWRLARGRVAEWVGPVALVADRVARRIGFRRAAEARLPVCAPDVRATLEAFALGVNAGATAGLPKKPHEFAIVGGEPSAWDAADVLAVLSLQSFMLPSNWDVELARLRVLLADGPAALRELDPSLCESARVRGCEGEKPTISFLPHALTPSHPHTALDQLLSDLSALQSHLPRGGGSNNWVVSGARTASGKPILANDPHLAPTCPPPWYLQHVRTPNWEVTGAALAGTPVVSIGHNGFCAWGVTAGLTDNSDFFLETLGPDGRSAREADGTFRPCEVVRETIRVKGQPDVMEEVLVTARGPVLSPAIKDLPVALSLSATWLAARPVNGFFGAPAARSFEQFRAHFAAWPALPLNVVYADVEGNIGYQLVGEVPERKGGNGMLPRPADLPDSGWTGVVPFERMPHFTNPEAGFVASANDNVTGSPDFGADYIDDYRARRIREELARRPEGLTPADCAALQLDIQSLPWREMRDSVLSLTPASADAREGRDLLANWNGRVEADSPPAAVFQFFVAQMCVRVARAKAPTAWPFALGAGRVGAVGGNLFADRRVAHLSRLVREQPAGWFASWPAEMEAALAHAVRELRKFAGPSPAYWAWGHLRMLRLEHPLFGNHKWLGPAFNRGPVPWGGDSNTVSQAGVKLSEPAEYTHNIANLRCVFDLADLAKSTFALAGGQSGNPLSPHHADQFELWRVGESFAVPWVQEDVIRAATATLRLLPE